MTKHGPYPLIVRCFLILFVAAMVSAQAAGQTVESEESLAAARSYFLDDLIQPHTYAPGKNSFLIQTLHRGQRKTVLDLKGSGSVRHIWSTWSIPGSDSVPPGRIFLRVYVDNQSVPAISGTMDELCRAAAATGTRFVPFPAFNYKDAYNFYLPIFFKDGIRIEIEAVDEVDEFYTQIDYRTERGAPPPPTRLVSESTEAGLVLKYTGTSPRQLAGKRFATSPRIPDSQDLQCDAAAKPCELVIDGHGILRSLTFHGDISPDMKLEIYWDGDQLPSVQAPLKYFFADFVNVALESTPRNMTCYFPMPFRQKARIVLRSATDTAGHLIISYSVDRNSVTKTTPYFHASYQNVQETVGYLQYPVLRVRGRGLFVGMNLFDSGHNHGGGDAALIDGNTNDPHVLHGICGEDYFGFAWHHTGTMTPLTGAPAHERRYRLHLENPYPFHTSFQFLFGGFAGLHPKSVAFWYQFSESAKHANWVGVDAPWKTIGPLGADTPPPNLVNDQRIETTVPINKPTTLTEQWQDVAMNAGFLDLTYQFRHYALTENGSGFVPGTSRAELITYLFSPSTRVIDARLGHDDAVCVRVNRTPVAEISGGSGFSSSNIRIPLHGGWNELNLVLSNTENVNWRWSGLSLALRPEDQNRGLKFAVDRPFDK